MDRRFQLSGPLRDTARSGPEVRVGGRWVALAGDPAVAATARALHAGPSTFADLDAAVGHPRAELRRAVTALDRLGLVEHLVLAPAGPAGARPVLMSAAAISPRPQSWPAAAELDPESATHVVLSRFALLRRDGDVLAAESPLSPFRVRLPDPRVSALVGRLACGGVDPSALRGRSWVGALPTRTVLACLAVLVHAGVATASGHPQDPGSTQWEQECPELAWWSVHDLWFHSRSRPGAHDLPVGGTFPLDGRCPVPPADPPTRGTEIALPDVDLARVRRRDPPFGDVVDRRRSRRRHGRDPIDRERLGEFLFRAARVMAPIPAAPAAGIPYDSSRRPYPGGGGAYELEVHLVVSRCSGLDAGVYHYLAHRHALERTAPSGRRATAALAAAAAATAFEGTPQVLIVLTARIGRLAWKYSGMAYATCLKDVGVLYQTMYLTAAAMGLAACAVGTGNSPQLAATLGRDQLDEPAVGEFLLGSAD
ncbi:MAG: SagB family peptide dehydrogenase [Pseudonocardia sp.]